MTLLLFACCAASAQAQQVRQGVWAGRQVQALPLPTRGYQAYLVGELHGIEENAAFQLRYLTELNRTSGLRDVAIEEKAVFEERAQAYVDGRADTLPDALCLRAEILDGIRLINAGLPKDRRIRVHLVDIDSPGSAIREHLLALRGDIKNAADVAIPEDSAIKEHGLQAVDQLRRYRSNSRIRSSLRTIEYSIRAYQQGFEVGLGPPTGSPYLNDREQAVADNIVDLIRLRPARSVLVLYGSDHVSKAARKDGGPDRDQPFSPMALRLEQAGIRVFCVVTFPLMGRSSWRGSKSDLPWTPDDGRLATGETFGVLLATVPEARFIYVNTHQTRVRLPSQDVSHFAVDAFLLFPSAAPMSNHCAAP